ncbi:MAG: ATP-binding protein [Acidimicrobiales bacterium]|nr:ATP-binding protein [Acidimicrobiales bacterium]
MRHAGTPFELSISVDEAHVTVSVLDHDRAHVPHVRSPRPQDTTGRGLMIVERMATSWGYEDVATDAKTVWFSL